MGSFVGHCVGGSMLIVSGLWWLINILCRYVTSVKHGVPFYTTSWFPARKWPTVELDLFVSLVFFYIIGEIVTGFQTPTGDFSWKNTQHMAAYAIMAIVRIIQRLEYNQFVTIPNLDYFCYASSAVITGILFQHHLHARDIVDVALHTFLSYGFFAQGIATFVEMFVKTMPLLPVLRCLLTMFNGVYLCTIGFIIYPPHKDGPLLDLGSHEVYNMITAFWVLELLLLIVGAMLLTSFLNKTYEGDTVYLRALQDEVKIPVEIRSNGYHLENGRPSKQVHAC